MTSYLSVSAMAAISALLLLAAWIDHRGAPAAIAWDDPAGA